MVEKLSQRPTLVCPSPVRLSVVFPIVQLVQNVRLCPINSVKCLVQEEANGPTCINPRGTILIKARRVPQHSQDVYHDETEAGEGDLRARQLVVRSKGWCSRAVIPGSVYRDS
jgi:hypothetical protein